jgi:hypothetical protein
MKYAVTIAHRASTRTPLELFKGEFVTFGEVYKGPENWPDWVWCVNSKNAGSWVPLQILERRDDGTAVVLEKYSARELDVDIGDLLTGFEEMNGWEWCVLERNGEAGWVPCEKLRPWEDPGGIK